MPWFVWLFPFAVVAVFPAFWWGVLWLVSRAGWRRLAESYRTDVPATGRTFRMTSGAIGRASYSHTLTVSIEPDGLRIAVLFPFRPHHPPLLIPWDEIQDVRPRTILGHTSYALDTAAPKPVTIRLTDRVVEAIREEGADL